MLLVIFSYLTFVIVALYIPQNIHFLRKNAQISCCSIFWRKKTNLKNFRFCRFPYELNIPALSVGLDINCKKNKCYTSIWIRGVQNKTKTTAVLFFEHPQRTWISLVSFRAYRVTKHPPPPTHTHTAIFFREGGLGVSIMLL